eukprot:3785682-Pyramimonas_sp.AAC.1
MAANQCPVAFSSFWRTWPEWSRAPELRRISFHHAWANDRRFKSRAGVGLGPTEIHCAGRDMLMKLLRACKRWGRTP